MVTSSDKYATYDQVTKPACHLAEQDGGDESFDEDFTIRTRIGTAIHSVELRAYLDEKPTTW